MGLNIEDLKAWAEVQGHTFYDSALSLDSFYENLIFTWSPGSQDDFRFIISQAPRFIDSMQEFKSKVDSLGFYDPSLGTLFVSNIESVSDVINTAFSLQDILEGSSLFTSVGRTSMDEEHQLQAITYKDNRQLDFNVTNLHGEYALATGYLCQVDKERLEVFKQKLNLALSTLEFIDCRVKKREDLFIHVHNNQCLVADDECHRINLKSISFYLNVNDCEVRIENHLPNFRDAMVYSLENPSLNNTIEELLLKF